MQKNRQGLCIHAGKTMNNFDVIGFGALNIDYINKIQKTPTGKEAHIDVTFEQAGGSAGNTLCGLSKLGLRTGAVGRVGIDEKSNILINSFYDYGVDFSQVSIDRKSSTGYSHVYVDRFGKRTMYTKPGSNSSIEKQHINMKYLEQSSWLHYSDFIDEKQFALQLWIANTLHHKRKISLWLDGNILKLGYRSLRTIFPYINVVFIKEHTLQILLSTETVEAVEKILADGVDLVTVIHSPWESSVYSKEESHRIKSAKSNIIDETGISCAYAAGFIFGQIHGYDIKRSGTFGNTLMSFCAKQIGCRSHFPTVREMTKQTSLLKEEKNVLIVGSGGREHAIAWKLHQSPRVRRLYAAPGNPGIAEVAHLVPIAETDIKKLMDFAKTHDIDLTVVGPEIPLAKGITDIFENEGIPVFGPSKKAAELETSKVFAKRFMKKFHIPTSWFRAFSNYKKAKSFLTKARYPLVIKADGLAAGKGVKVCTTKIEAEEWLSEIMKLKRFGDAGKKIVVEEFLNGEEASILAFSDGHHIIPLIPAQDHKRIFDEDKGPNTGGMGAYAPAPIITDSLLETITNTILKPTIKGMAEIGRPYKGILYAGIMVTKEGPKVLEYNCRFGDPEAQAVLPLLKSDLLELMEATLFQRVQQQSIQWDDKASICIIAAAGGYPDKAETGKIISGLQTVNSGSKIFQAGTRSQIISSGGRVLGVMATGKNLKQAIKKAYNEIGHVSFEHMQHRKDIGKKGLLHTHARKD